MVVLSQAKAAQVIASDVATRKMQKMMKKISIDEENHSQDCTHVK